MWNGWRPSAANAGRGKLLHGILWGFEEREGAMSAGLVYKEPRDVSKEEREKVLTSGNIREIADAMLSCSLNGDDYDYSIRALRICAKSEDVIIKSLAVICTSHIFRTFGRIPEQDAEELIVTAATSDAAGLKGSAVAALEDFAEWNPEFHQKILLRIGANFQMVAP